MNLISCALVVIALAESIGAVCWILNAIDSRAWHKRQMWRDKKLAMQEELNEKRKTWRAVSEKAREANHGE